MEQGHPVRMLRAGVVRGKEQQLLARQHLCPAVRPPQGQQNLQGGVPLLNLDIRHPPAQHGGNVPPIPAGDNLSHRPSTGEQAVQVAVQESLDALLIPPHRHRAEKVVQRPLCLLVLAGHPHAAGQPGPASAPPRPPPAPPPEWPGTGKTPAGAGAHIHRSGKRDAGPPAAAEPGAGLLRGLLSSSSPKSHDTLLSYLLSNVPLHISGKKEVLSLLRRHHCGHEIPDLIHGVVKFLPHPVPVPGRTGPSNRRQTPEWRRCRGDK